MKNDRRGLTFSVVLVGIALLVGCSTVSKHMRLVPPGTTYRPGSQESLIIFMRPSPEEPGLHSSVFELTPAEDKLVGIVSGHTKVAYVTTPGEHTFMSIGRDALFLKTRLGAGKTYYVLVTPVHATWKDDYVLTPIKSSDLSTDTFKKWIGECAYVENTPASYEWAKRNAKSIESKKRASLSEWERKPDTEKPTLTPEDGM